MSNGIQNSPSIKHHMKQQTGNRNGPITRKSNREQMQSTELLQLSFPSPQKKGSLADFPSVFYTLNNCRGAFIHYLLFYERIYVREIPEIMSELSLPL